MCAALTLAIAGIVPAYADQHCSTAGGGAETPHLIDSTGDWNGGTGTGTGLVPAGDVWREGSDVTAAWIAANPDPTKPGKYQAHVQIANLQGFEANQVVSFLWKWEGDKPEKVRRYVSASFNGRGVSYSYGYVGTSAAGNGEIHEDGSTTGKIVVGSPGEVVIDIKFAQMGSPTVGSVLGEPLAETRLLIGAAGTGLLSTADDTSDGDGCAEITLS